MRRATRLAAALAALVLGAAACGATGGPGGTAAAPDALTIGVLLPESETSRYETFDRPLIEQEIAARCADCTVSYANAHNDVRAQHQQMNAMLTQGIDVVILDAVTEDSMRGMVTQATEEGIPVLAYDRLTQGPISGYVSFDSDAIGELQGEGVLSGLGDQADGAQVVRVEGPVWSIEHPAEAMLEQAGAEISGTYWGPAWSPENGYSLTTAAIADLGPDNIDAVWAGNDALAAGVISALKHARIDPLPPVTGQDAELPAVRSIVAGEMHMTVYKPYQLQAEAAAEMALALGRGESLDSIATGTVNTATARDIPSVELQPLPLTVDNIEETVIRDGMYTLDEICIPKYRRACEAAGLVGPAA
ncbi:substrate-binding domain-containing protein [Streptomyces durbertensis]|uniref:substrate-binding domain-containing protein n=1 Tax=Streptomyces durbertensis TaxID=2448886 RepID=UPI002B21630A|nr:substrate-binding domain-containing protein [Streptomyces durbertensis]